LLLGSASAVFEYTPPRLVPFTRWVVYSLITTRCIFSRTKNTSGILPSHLLFRNRPTKKRKNLPHTLEIYLPLFTTILSSILVYKSL
jgi:hypothetical protein